MPSATQITPPRRLLVFGASGHVGGPLAQLVCATAPEARLRVATSSAGKAEELEQRFPGAEVVVANYYDPGSLKPALSGIEGVFIITPDFIDEERAMSNLAEAARAAGTVRRAIRITGLPPAVSVDEPPAPVEDPGPALQHLHAVRTLRARGVPVTVLNSAGYFMDNFTTHFAPPLHSMRRLVIPFERRMCFTDPGELGQVAARLLLADDVEPHLDGTCHFNSGEAPIPFAEVATMLSEAIGVKIVHDPDAESFLKHSGPTLAQFTGDERAAHRLLTDFRAELEHEASFFASPLGEELLGRKPTSLRAWLHAHRAELRP